MMRINPLSLRLLRSFVAVAEDLHFGRAAKKLGISQPPLSQHIQVLEAEVGMRLLNRNRRSVGLTAAGRLLYEEAVGLLAHAERVRQVVEGCRAGTDGALSIGCVPSALAGVLPVILRRFRALHPRVNVMLHEAHTATIVEQVADRTVDLGLAWENAPALPVLARPVWRDVFVAALPEGHRLAGQDQVTLAELGKEVLVVSPRRVTPHHYDSVISAFARAGITPRIGHEPATVLSQVAFVANGFGVGMVPPFAASFPVEGVTYRRISGELPAVELCLLWHRDLTDGPATILRGLMPACGAPGHDAPACHMPVGDSVPT